MRTPFSAGLVVAFSVLVMFVGAPVAAADQLDDVRTQIAAIQEHASEVGEQYDQITDQLTDEQAQVDITTKDIALQKAKVQEALETVQPMLLAQFRDRNIDTSTAVFGSDDPDAFLDRISVSEHYQSNLSQLVQDYQLKLAALNDLQREQDAQVALVAKTQADLAALKADLDAQEVQAEQLLMRLTAAQAAELNGGKGVTYDPDKLDLKGSNPKVVKAVKYAVSKAGVAAYVWATAGPDTFDCSGLMLAAYEQAGIALPHFSGAQAKLGHSVEEIKDLKPGDLIFFYSPIHHVGMYIGNGLFVHARNPQVGVVIQPLASYDAPITAMRRIVG